MYSKQLGKKQVCYLFAVQPPYIGKFLRSTIQSNLLQTSTMNAYILATVCPAAFICGALLQFWIFRLFHKFGHPWARIIYPENDSTKKRKRTTQVEKSAEIFGQFWQQVEQESESKLKNGPRYSAARIRSKDVPVQINDAFIHD